MGSRAAKLEYTILCDDIREEIGNKITFVGSYGPDIFVTKLPYSFPKLCFVSFCKDMKSGDLVTFLLSDPTGKQLGKTINATVPKDGIGPAKKLTIFAIFSPLLVNEEGLYKLITTFNQDDKSKQEFDFSIKLAQKTK